MSVQGQVLGPRGRVRDEARWHSDLKAYLQLVLMSLNLNLAVTRGWQALLKLLPSQLVWHAFSCVWNPLLPLSFTCDVFPDRFCLIYLHPDPAPISACIYRPAFVPCCLFHGFTQELHKREEEANHQTQRSIY